MKLVELKLPGVDTMIVNPLQVSHVQPLHDRDECLLWLKADNLPTTIGEGYLEVVSQLNDAMYEDAPVFDLRNEFVSYANALIREIRRLQWAFGIAALAFLILLLVIVGRS